MKNLVGMAIFARVVEANGFSEAARRLGLSKSLVSKEVTKLEKSLGARLLNRTTRKLSLTEIGAAFYEHCARVVREAEEAELVVGRLHGEPRGVLKLTTPVAFGTLHIAPALPEFLAAISRCLDRPHDQRPRLRPGRGRLRPVGSHRERPAAERRRASTRGRQSGRLRDTGLFRQARDTAGAEGPGRTQLPRLHARESGFRVAVSRRGAQVVVPVTGNLTLNDDEALWQAVLGGLGISLLPTFIVGKDLQAGRLQAVLADYVPSERSLHAVYLPNRHLSAKVRVFIDFLVARFVAPPYWDRDWLPAEPARPAPIRRAKAAARATR